MAGLERVPKGVDVSVPSSARVYDYLLGGKDNYAVDRKVAEKLLSVAPDTRSVARANRAFLARAVRFLAAQGIRQFIDLGTGIPTPPSVHELAREADPSARVVYVDNDPVVKVHNDALLATDEGVITVEADVRRPEVILADPRLRALIDFSAPVGVLFLTVLHFVTDEEDARGIVARWREEMTSGSYVVISNMTAGSDPEALRNLRAMTANTPAHSTFRTHDELMRFFDGFELVEPGLLPVQEWRPLMDHVPTLMVVEGGVGRKP
ncbi:SAM-dependent methyltransferase [Planotetraspora sp. A-T 1434]|uniref:SAM-dependent methyltransferase n=1 Tax=Planotetraspora sp. A-T 1434 TaxID=2979219 RepID=UPI0021C14FDD|nr:SAM-dependent methyltransferase [Planotetraspora sp. A-T 1434]MCT9930735.1 SAM-dependent methyltransferase [Planotetraspora sp. A-T 1434]